MPLVNAKSESTAILPLLYKLHPPHTLIHIGAGTGMGPLHQWHDWQIPDVWLIDAVPKRLAWTKTRTGANWHTLAAILDEQDGERTFHDASNPDEQA